MHKKVPEGSNTVSSVRPARKIQTVDDVKHTFSLIKKADAREAMARAMCKHGNLTDEALLYLGDNYPLVWKE